jgi:hypothetical protein
MMTCSVEGLGEAAVNPAKNKLEDKVIRMSASEMHFLGCFIMPKG